MNPVDHRTAAARPTTRPWPPVTPWGKPTLGYRTRKKGKQSDRYIVAADVAARRRAEGNHGSFNQKGPWSKSG